MSTPLTGRFHLLRLVESLERAGIPLARAHRKGNDGLGKTSAQLMLVFERGQDPMEESQKAELVEKFFSPYDYAITAHLNNGQAGRVPPHVYLNCGNARERKDETLSLNLRIKRLADAAKEKGMVRIGLNLYGDMEHLIPKWVPSRSRHSEKVAAAEIGALADEIAGGV